MKSLSKRLCYFAAIFALIISDIYLSAITPSQSADTIFFDGDIVTVNDKQPTAEAVAVKNGRIIFVGDKETAFSYKTDNTQLIDLKGKTLLPGFIDPHTHVTMEGLILNSVDVSPFKYKTIDQVLNVLKDAAKKGPVLAFGYDPSLMTNPGKLDFDTLDSISTEVPIVVINKSGHIAYGNHKAFEIAKITESSPNPPGGSYQRDQNGHLTGVAMEVPGVSTLASAVQTLTPGQITEITKRVLKVYAQRGYTTVTDLALGLSFPTPMDHIKSMQDAANDPNSPVRLQGYVIFSLLDKIPELQKNNNDMFKILGMKIWADGSLQGYTAALKERYKDKDTRGILNFTQNQLNQYVLNAHKKNLQVAIHANGDQAIEDALNAYENALKLYPKEDSRFRMEHATVTDPNQWKRMAKLKVTPSFTEHHVYYWGEVFKDKILGEPRADYIDAAKTAQDLGIKFSFNDDALAGLSPLLFIQVASTREMENGGILNPQQVISVDEAIKAMTLYPAWQSFRDKDLGSIEVGKFADFVLLDQNPKKIDKHKIRDIRVLETWVNGKKRVSEDNLN